VVAARLHPKCLRFFHELAEDLRRNLISHLFERQDSNDTRITVPVLIFKSWVLPLAFRVHAVSYAQDFRPVKQAHSGRPDRTGGCS
jgi:hypothetical protein